MTWNVETTTTPIARKEYHCEASDWISNMLMESDMEPEDYKIVEAARKEGNKILKGTKYVKTKGIWEGKAETFRARLDLLAICENYNLFEE